MNQWGSSPWGDNDGQQSASGMPGSPFDSSGLQPGAPPVFGDHPGFPSQGWGQPPGYGGYPPQFTPQPPEERRRNAKVIGLVAAAVIVVLALLVGSIVFWTSGSGDSGSDGLSEADAAAGKAEIAGVERPPAAAQLPSLSAAPTNNLWSYPPGGADAGGLATVVGGDTKTVLVGLNDSLIALDARNGSQIWQKPGAFEKCVLSTSGTTALCAAADKSAALLDMATGATKGTASNQGGLPFVYSGAGLLAYLDHQKNLTVFDDSGRQLWTKPMPGQVSVFLDQGVMAEKVRDGLSTKFYDAKTGNELFSIGAVDDVVATSRGIAVSQRRGGIMSGGKPRQRIDFYSFTGKLAWRIPGDRGYRLPDTSVMPRFGFKGSVPYTTSGVASPIVYSEEKGEVAGVDTLTGELTWSQPVPMSSDTLVSLMGIGTLCVVSYSEVGTRAGGVRVRDCTDGTGAFVDGEQLSGSLIATDGKQIVGRGDGPVSAFDTATGQRAWQFPDDVYIVTWAGDGLYIEGYKGLMRVA